ncbi:hypothetical protein HII28_09500 [Planctomonas sp. JC2975]|uniref:hypothetical protein n=1 Tax=Planctomonas sp. JC2975 TaxID=2729626 RepID=UPI00147290AB|nr:hypothetical protein [Planctomonas sp. JC2975]NNC12111.1 hypothetical protein [Planctomonas sp. JC2975]
MTAGDGIKKGAEGTKNVTDKVVDSVEKKINDVTDAVARGIHRGASQSDMPEKKA